MSIVERIRAIEDLGYISGCSDTQIKEAEELLGLKFPKEYVEYVKEFGCIDFGSTEWTGLNIEGELNTVEATLEERKYNGNFPDKHFVLEDYHIDSKKVIVNELGEVFLLQYDKVERLCTSISGYLEERVRNA